ncbi:peptidylprolyl isomerase [Dysgonomonas sp. 511]|uniref:peptidylprolyl isomerase n=1 Tax=Dysgonomonas sp. 511 TaxID=2302930 RepID=UPI0013D2E2DE|nr:peptidylprolyl isomerase [Dysgonomonas sp. 511]NDV79040.1 hypothetical protein [Dysgonomonas sp. 511]
MAALQKIRSKSGLLVGIIAAGLLAFVIPWNEVFMFFNNMKDKAFTVNGTVVKTGEYEKRVIEWQDFQQEMSGGNNPDEFTMLQIREAVYQQMVKEMMLDEQAEKLGLAVTKQEMEDMIYGQNISPILYQLPFFRNPQTGQFDPAMVTQFLTEINTDPASLPQEQYAVAEQLRKARSIWSFIQNMIKYNRLEEKYSTLVANSLLVSNTEVQSAQNDSKDVADIAYVVQKYTSISDSTVNVDNSEIKALYEARKNNYKLNTELRKISYFIKNVTPSDEDYAVVEKEAEDVYLRLKETENPGTLVGEYSTTPYVDAFMAVSALPADAKAFVESASVGDIHGPVREGQGYLMYKLVDRTVASDSIKLRMIPMPQGIDLATSNHIADSLMAVVKGGKAFADVANEIAPNSNGGDLNWVTEVMLAGSGIGKEIFAAAKGDVLKLNVGGISQLFYVEDKKAPVSKVKLAQILMPVIVSDKTQNAIDNELNQFVAENNKAEGFEQAAQVAGYNIVSDALVSPDEISLGQATGTRQVIAWSFNNPVGTVNKFDVSDKRIVAVVKSEIKGDYMPISEVSSALRAELINDKKAEKMIADFKSKNLTSLADYANAVSGKVDTVKFVTFQTNTITGIGYEPIVNVYARSGQINKLDAPLKGKQGVYALLLTSKTEEAAKTEIEQSRQMLKQSNMYQLMSQAINVLRDKMDVKDNRVNIWR